MTHEAPISADIIAVGSELLGFAKLDTNSLYLAKALGACGITLRRKLVVADDCAEIQTAVTESLRHVRFIFLTGGLGPTADDKTREAVTNALDRSLTPDLDMQAKLRGYFAARRRTPLGIDLRPANRIKGADWLDNPGGSAPGQWCQQGDVAVILLPGPPAELQAVFESVVRARLQSLVPPAAFFTRVLSLVGMAEAEVEQRVATLYRTDPNVQVTILATAGLGVELHLVARAGNPEQAQIAADSLALDMESRLGAAVFSRDGESLPEVVGKLLLGRGQQVSVAESCTGGLVSSRLTEVAGASAFYAAGVVCYSDTAKRDLAAVPEQLIATHGPVSAPVAAAMAEGIRLRTGAAWGLAVTGFAGPTGGTAEAPLGTVICGLAFDGRAPLTQATRFFGDRERVRRAAAQYALNQLRLALGRLEPAAES